MVDVSAGLPQEHLENHLGSLVLTFAEVVVADPALGIDEVERRPVVVVEGLPHGVVVVDGDRVPDIELLDAATDVVEIPLELELGSLHADDGQSVTGVLLRPGPHVRE